MSLPLIIALFVAALFLLYQLYPLYRSRQMRGHQVSQLSGIVPDSVLGKPRYLLYFWAPQCGMCRGMTPVVDRLQQQHEELVKIDASQHPDIAHELGVMGTPALVVVKQGAIEKVMLGAKSEGAILKLLKHHD